jgi:hypothetical protein
MFMHRTPLWVQGDLTIKDRYVVCAAWGSKPQARGKTWKSTEVDSKTATRVHIRPIFLKDKKPRANRQLETSKEQINSRTCNSFRGLQRNLVARCFDPTGRQ